MFHLKSESKISLHTQSELQRPNSRWIVATKRPCAANYNFRMGERESGREREREKEREENVCKMVNTPFVRIWYEYEARLSIRFTLILIRHSIFDSVSSSILSSLQPMHLSLSL